MGGDGTCQSMVSCPGNIETREETEPEAKHVAAAAVDGLGEHYLIEEWTERITQGMAGRGPDVDHEEIV